MTRPGPTVLDTGPDEVRDVETPSRGEVGEGREGFPDAHLLYEVSPDRVRIPRVVSRYKNYRGRGEMSSTTVRCPSRLSSPDRVRVGTE